MKESTLTRNILRALRNRGGWWVKIAGQAGQTTGIPDILGVYWGRFVALEVKVPGREIVSDRQDYILERVRLEGGTALIVTSIEDALQALDQIDATL